MDRKELENLFTQETLDRLFPRERSDMFFEALYGDCEEGAYDIRLRYREAGESRLVFELHLEQRPGKCLACNLTYGLPEVFTRHPIIDLNGLVEKIKELLPESMIFTGWKLGRTTELSRDLHAIPLLISHRN